MGFLHLQREAREGTVLQSGYFRNYALVFVVGVVAIGGGLIVMRAFS